MSVCVETVNVCVGVCAMVYVIHDFRFVCFCFRGFRIRITATESCNNEVSCWTQEKRCLNAPIEQTPYTHTLLGRAHQLNVQERDISTAHMIWYFASAQ